MVADGVLILTMEVQVQLKYRHVMVAGDKTGPLPIYLISMLQPINAGNM